MKILTNTSSKLVSIHASSREDATSQVWNYHK